MSETSVDPAVLMRMLDRERRARSEAERLLESKSVDLYRANEQLLDFAEDLAARERYVSAILEAAQDAILVVDADGTVETSNPAAQQLFAVAAEGLHGQPLVSLLALDGHPGPASADDLLAALDRQRLHEGSATTSDRREIPVRLAVGRTQAEQPRHILVIHDLSEERASAEALHRTAYHDPVTGLENRAALLERLKGRRTSDNVALIAVDIHRFHRVNDSLGRAVGDQVLRTLAERLTDPFSDGGSFITEVDEWAPGRIGPDEFAVMITGSLTPASVEAAVRRVRELIETPIAVENFTIPLESCVGYALCTDGQGLDGTDTIIDRAVIALDHARGRAGQRVSAYRPHMGAERARVLAVEGRIRHGLANGEFVAHFQPRIDVATGEIVACEALARWDSPERGLLLPAAFIPIAEESSLIADIGATIFEQALHLQRVCMDEGVARPISINLSNLEFTLPSIAEGMAAAALAAQVPTHLIEVELQESVIMDDLDHSSRLLNRLAEFGFLIAMDDFGTGHSSLGRLRSLPIDVLKLDRSFVRAVPDDVQSSKILSAMIQLAEAIGAKVVVEGVETEAQLQVVRQAGTCEVQGFLYSPAVDASRYLEMVGSQPWRKVESA